MANKLYSGIVNLLEDGRDELRKYNLEKKSILLFLGASGVGKSTCINYLKGCVMEEKNRCRNWASIYNCKRFGCRNWKWCIF